jgi:uncharacterized coiled-coil protein SlyX
MTAAHDDLWSSAGRPDASRAEARLDELELRLAFLDQAVATLTDTVTALQLQRERDQNHLRGMLDELSQLRRALISDPANEPPPHY